MMLSPVNTGWVSGFISLCGTFLSVCDQSPRSTQLQVSILYYTSPGVGVGVPPKIEDYVHCCLNAW